MGARYPALCRLFSQSTPKNIFSASILTGGLNSNGRRRQREKVALTRARVAGAYTIRDVGSMEVNLFGCRSEPSRGGVSFLGYMFC